MVTQIVGVTTQKRERTLESQLATACNRCRYWIANALSVVLLTGCASVVKDPSPLPSNEDFFSLPEYRIESGDEIDVKFYYTPELNETVTVRPDGRISLQLVSDVKAAGLTPAELKNLLVRSYSRELKRPEIAVILRGFAGQRVYVDGEVKNPSEVPLSSGMTVLHSIAMAGGLTDRALPNETIVIRRGRSGYPEVFSLNMTSVVDGSDIRQDIALKPFDVVYVPKSPVSKLNIWVDQYLRMNLPVNFSLGYRLNPED